MGRKIFVSYKYADDLVENLSVWENSTARDYVTRFETILAPSDNIYKGESDGEDLSTLSKETILKKLRDRIYDSSITVVFISPGMRDPRMPEKEQWIPWEIAYSLRETSRHTKSGELITSRTNAMLAVALPDRSGSYSYYFERKDCCSNKCIVHHTDRLFQIIRKNMFNQKQAKTHRCAAGDTIWESDCSYIKAIRWCDFIQDYSGYLEESYKRRDNISDYFIAKNVD